MIEYLGNKTRGYNSICFGIFGRVTKCIVRKKNRNKNKMHSENVLVLGHDSSLWFCDLGFDV